MRTTVGRLKNCSLSTATGFMEGATETGEMLRGTEEDENLDDRFGSFSP